MTTPWLAFLGLCLVMTVTPGLDTAVVVRNTLSRGVKAGLLTAAGCASGLFVHAVAVALGLAAVLLSSAAAFNAVRLGGAVLLIVMGVAALVSAFRGQHVSDEVPLPARQSRAFLQGLATNLTNPKASLFFLSALPQFVPADAGSRAVPMALLLAIIAGCFSWFGLSLFVLLAGRARRLLASPKARRAQEAGMGAVLVGLGVNVALNHA